MTDPNDREFNERWRQRVYAAQTDLIDAYGGCKRVVEKQSVSKSQVGRFYGGSDRDFMPLPLVMALEAKVDQPIVSAVMVEFLGREVAGESVGTNTAACLSALNAELVEITGRMMVETVRAKADGQVTPNEAKQLRELSRRAERIRAEIDDLLAAAEAGEAALRVVR